MLPAKPILVTTSLHLEKIEFLDLCDHPLGGPLPGGADLQMCLAL